MVGPRPKEEEWRKKLRSGGKRTSRDGDEAKDKVKKERESWVIFGQDALVLCWAGGGWVY